MRLATLPALCTGRDTARLYQSVIQSMTSTTSTRMNPAATYAMRCTALAVAKAASAASRMTIHQGASTTGAVATSSSSRAGPRSVVASMSADLGIAAASGGARSKREASAVASARPTESTTSIRNPGCSSD